MTYELAKQLKDAGFPQNSRDTICWDEVIYRNTTPNPYSDKSASIPTLSELIEACKFPPDIFVHEIHLSKFAYGSGGYKYGAYVCCQPINVDACDTPEEAVAKLWLKLINVKEEK